MTIFEVVSELNGLLPIKLFPSKHNKGYVLGGIVNNVFRHIQSNNPTLANYENTRLVMLIKHLKEIKSYDAKLFNFFVSSIEKAKNDDSYFGLRFEIDIASSLIRNNVCFIKSERPDFTIKSGNTEVYIECGSSRIRESKRTDLLNKILSTIFSKKMEPYANRNTALSIDITNINFNILDREGGVISNDVRGTIKNYKDSPFGAIILFTYMFDKQNNRFKFDYIRDDSEEVDSDLKVFLDKVYPFGLSATHEPTFPVEG